MGTSLGSQHQSLRMRLGLRKAQDSKATLVNSHPLSGISKSTQSALNLSNISNNLSEGVIRVTLSFVCTGLCEAIALQNLSEYYATLLTFFNVLLYFSLCFVMNVQKQGHLRLDAQQFCACTGPEDLDSALSPGPGPEEDPGKENGDGVSPSAHCTGMKEALSSPIARLASLRQQTTTQKCTFKPPQKSLYSVLQRSKV